jgi:biotin operon repressor
VSDWRDSKAVLRHVVGLDASAPKQKHGYYEVQNDFFLESSLIIAKLLEKDPSQVTTKTSKPLLSEMQLEIWKSLNGKCLSAKELGKSFDLSAENIRKHIQAIRNKFGQKAVENTRSRGYWRPDNPPSDSMNKA